jgi:cytochrome c oxidase assembly protein subunit 15
LVLVHRSLSLLLLLANGVLVWALWKWTTPDCSAVAGQLERDPSRGRLIRRLGIAMLAILVAEAAVGTVLFYFAIPAFLQPVHLLLAALLAGAQLAIWILFRSVLREGTI